MDSKRAKFLIGLFVLGALTIGTIIIIWAGASDFFVKGSLYVTYFDESVQGLQNDSAVKYRGVEIGKVESIQVAPDYKLIEVTMKIDLVENLAKHTFAQLRTAGITGIIFIELDRIDPGTPVDFQTVDFHADYPIIPSRRSEISRFLADTEKIMHNIREIDFQSIANQLKVTTKAIETLLASDHTDNILRNIDSISVNLDKSIDQINKVVADGTIESILKETAATVTDVRDLINRTKREVEALKLAGHVAKSGEILDTIDQKTKSITIALKDTSENLRITSEHLQKLAESLSNNPSELIFSRPAPPRKKLE